MPDGHTNISIHEDEEGPGSVRFALSQLELHDTEISEYAQKMWKGEPVEVDGAEVLRDDY